MVWFTGDKMCNRFVAWVYFNGQIHKSERPKRLLVDQTVTLEELRVKIHTHFKLGHRKLVPKINYGFPVRIDQECFRYGTFRLEDDDDVRFMFDAHNRRFPNIRIIELYAEVDDVDDADADCESSDVPTRISWPFDNAQSETPPSTQMLMNNFHEFLRSTSVSAVTPRTRGHEPYRVASSVTIDSPIRGVEMEAAIPSLIGADPRPTNAAYGEFVNKNFGQDVLFPDSNTLQMSSSTGGELYSGMRFYTKEDLLLAVEHYNIKNSRDYIVFEPYNIKGRGPRGVTFQCKCKMYGKGCNWRISFRKSKQQWQIMTYKGPHTCTRGRISQDHCK